MKRCLFLLPRTGRMRLSENATHADQTAAPPRESRRPILCSSLPCNIQVEGFTAHRSTYILETLFLFCLSFFIFFPVYTEYHFSSFSHISDRPFFLPSRIIEYAAYICIYTYIICTYRMLPYIEDRIHIRRIDLLHVYFMRIFTLPSFLSCLRSQHGFSLQEMIHAALQNIEFHYFSSDI